MPPPETLEDVASALLALGGDQEKGNRFKVPRLVFLSGSAAVCKGFGIHTKYQHFFFFLKRHFFKKLNIKSVAI